MIQLEGKVNTAIVYTGVNFLSERFGFTWLKSDNGKIIIKEILI